MSRDVYAAVGALVRVELARTRTLPIYPPTEETAAHAQIVTPSKPAYTVAPSVSVRRRLRARVAGVRRRLSIVCG